MPKTHFLKPKIPSGGGSDRGRRGRGLSSMVAAWVSLFVSLFIFLSLSLISYPFLSLSTFFFFFFSLYLPFNQPSMVEMWGGTHGSVATFIIPDVVFIFRAMGFMDQWMGFIFGGVGGWISLFLGLVVVVFCGLVVGNLMVVWVVG